MIYSYDNFLREYARLSLYGFIIASNFLQILWDPEDIDFNQFYEQAQRLGVDFLIQVNNNNNKRWQIRRNNRKKIGDEIRTFFIIIDGV